MSDKTTKIHQLPPALLHLYSGETWHDEAYIVGNQEGLRRLWMAIGQLIDQDNPYQVVTIPDEKRNAEEGEKYLYTSDGEGYVLSVVKLNTDWQGEEWQQLKLPYTADLAVKCQPKDSLHPEEFIREKCNAMPKKPVE
jgi:hypothetical protein